MAIMAFFIPLLFYAFHAARPKDPWLTATSKNRLTGPVVNDCLLESNAGAKTDSDISGRTDAF